MMLGEHSISNPPVCTEDVSLAQVYEKLCSSPERLVIVVDSEAHRVPIGVITERSICDQVVRRLRDPRSLTAANVLDGNVVKLRRAHVLASQTEPAGERPVLVVDRDRKLVGLYAGRNLGKFTPRAAVSEPVATAGLTQ